MANDYKIIIKTPQSESAFFGDTWKEALTIFLKYIDVSQFDGSGVFVNLTAKKAQKYLRYHFPTKTRTKADERGIELDLIKCYVKGLKIEEAVECIGNEKGVILSKSCVGRYWRKLRLLNIDRL